MPSTDDDTNVIACSGAHFEKVGKEFSIRTLVKGGPAQRTGQMAVGDALVRVDGKTPHGSKAPLLSRLRMRSSADDNLLSPVCLGRHFYVRVVEETPRRRRIDR